MNDLNKGEGGALDENLEENQDAVKQLEAEKTRLLDEAMEELRKERHSQDQILHMAKRLAQLKGQDPDKGTSHTNIWYNTFLNLSVIHGFISECECDKSKNCGHDRSVKLELCLKPLILDFIMLFLVTMEDFQHPDSEGETEEEAVRRVLKQVWILRQNKYNVDDNE